MSGFDLRGDGKVAFVTGGANGLGRAAAQVFGEAGYAVALLDTDRTAGAQAVGTLTEAGVDALFLAADVCNTEEVDAAIEATLAKWNRLDVALNNAGISGRGGWIDELDEDELERVLAVDLKGVFYVCKRAVRAQKQRGSGSILNIASITAEGSAAYPAYAAAKGRGHSPDPRDRPSDRALQYPRERHQPGLDRGTGLMQREWANADRETRRARRLSSLRRIPLGRFADARDVAHVALFLASPLARHVHGTIVTVDGGELLGAVS